ncbi:MAG TPA: hypothetical protein VIS94_13920 [Desulfomonilia bacterium]
MKQADISKLQPQDETARKRVELFCELVFRLKRIHYTGNQLLDDDIQPLLKKTSKEFFEDIKNILIEYFILEVAKLTDPATSYVGKDEIRENLTVSNLIESIEWQPEPLQKIKDLNKTIETFREHIIDARRRLLAHYDMKTVLSGVTLGAFPERKDLELLNSLEEMCNVFHKEAFSEIFGEMIPNHRGDVLDLIMALKKAITFDKLISDNKGDDSERLNRFLLEFDQSSNLNHKGKVDF